MVARKLSSFDTTVSLESFAKQRPSIYIDPESNIYEDLSYLLEREKCSTTCINLWRSKEGKNVK